MKTKTNIRGGGMLNHNQTGIAVCTNTAKAGVANSNDNETVASGLRVCTAVKAGVSEIVVTKTTDCSSTN